MRPPDLIALIGRWLRRALAGRTTLGPRAPLPWLVEAERLRGVREIPGPESSPEIMAWAAAQSPRVRSVYKGDDVPWCGLFVAHCIGKAGFVLPINSLSALAWADWGEPLGRPMHGAVAVFKRPGGGHVGFVVGESTKGDLRILGGNQDDQVSIAWFPRDRLVAVRWPKGDGASPYAPLLRERDGAFPVKQA
jgi:uncharacterized protein (TIGR02594 family)